MKNKVILLVAILTAILLSSCKKEDKVVKQEENNDPVIAITTLQASEITTSSVTLNASFSSKEHSAQKAGFKYGVAPDALNLVVIGEINEDKVISKVDQLTPNTDYYFQAFAINASFETSSQEIIAKEVLKFTTEQEEEIENLRSLEATNVSMNSATLQGIILSEDIVYSKVGFMFGENKNLLDEMVFATLEGNKFSTLLEDLKSNSTYYYAAFGTPIGEESNMDTSKEIIEFITTSIPLVPPYLEMLEINYPIEHPDAHQTIYATEARFRCCAHAKSYSITEVGFYYGTSSNNLNQQIKASKYYLDNFYTNEADTIYYIDAKNLNQETEYWVKAYVIDEQGNLFETENTVQFKTLNKTPIFSEIEHCLADMFMYNIINSGDKAKEWGIKYGNSPNQLNYKKIGDRQTSLLAQFDGVYVDFTSGAPNAEYFAPYKIEPDGTEYVGTPQKLQDILP